MLFRFTELIGIEVFDASRAIEIGRSPDSDLWLDADTVSRQHCRLLHVDGDLYIEDRRSSNGSFLNGNRVVEPLAIEPRDTLQVGPYTIKARLLRAQTPPTPDRSPSVIAALSTRIEAVLGDEKAGAHLVVDLKPALKTDERVVRQLYLDAVRRRTGSEAPNPLPSEPTDTSVDATSQLLELPPMRPRTDLGDRRYPSLAPELAERARDLDVLIASLDARENRERAEVALQPWRGDPDKPTGDAEPAPKPVVPVVKKAVIPRMHAARLLTPSDEALEIIHSEFEKPSPPASPTLDGGSPPHVESSPPFGLNEDEEHEEQGEEQGEGEDEGGGFEGIEIRAIAGRGANVKPLWTRLRDPGEQYVLGHPTAGGNTVPSGGHPGLRLIRIAEDGAIHLVFPRDAHGHLTRGATTVLFEELAEGRPYSSLRLEADDRVELVLGQGTHQVSYDVRFCRHRIRGRGVRGHG
ncbi:MAG: FHA domain-containing protein [Deltaproteobacteria bacterium]|nr:FHA domain-containing protein [Deltaproteobacteria bacterium]